MELLQNMDVNNKRVILRCDFNVSIKDNQIIDDYKIIRSLDTINYLIDHNSKIVILSHLGKIKKEEDKQEELVALGCDASTEYCDSNETYGGTAPSWVYQTSYWSGSADDDDDVWTVYSNGRFLDPNCFDDYRYGVRPVIILEK